MKIRILGCSGGIGPRGSRTTALLIDDDLLIDAGTGVADLDLAALTRIDHVFVTHAHLDHVAFLPLMVDTFDKARSKPLTVHCTQATASALLAHVFNNQIWPDFTRIPNAERPFLRFNLIEPGQRQVHTHPRHGERVLTAIPVDHTVPAVAYRLDGPTGSLVFSGDTTCSEDFAAHLKQIAELRHLIIETAFPDSEHELARLSRHMCPAMLETQLRHETPRFELWITHLKPGHEQVTMREVRTRLARFRPQRLKRAQVFDL